jgi:hypothetical protein
MVGRDQEMRGNLLAVSLIPRHLRCKRWSHGVLAVQVSRGRRN